MSLIGGIQPELPIRQHLPQLFQRILPAVEPAVSGLDPLAQRSQLGLHQTAVVGAFVFWGVQEGILQRLDVEYGWPAYLGLTAAMIVAHDTYFYWAHRFMHHPRLFRHFHRPSSGEMEHTVGVLKMLERRGFRNAKGEPVANLALWKRLFALADARRVSTRWVRGHNGDHYNEMADRLANEAMDAAARGAVSGARTAWSR